MEQIQTWVVGVEYHFSPHTCDYRAREEGEGEEGEERARRKRGIKKERDIQRRREKYRDNFSFTAQSIWIEDRNSVKDLKHIYSRVVLEKEQLF